MKTQLASTKKDYKYIVIDCPPGLSILTEVSIRLANLVIVPTIADFLSTYGLLSFCRNLWTGDIAKESPLKKPTNKPHVLITRRRRIKEHNLTAAKLMAEKRRKKPSFELFDTVIPEMTGISAALSKIQVVDEDGSVVNTWPTYLQKWKTAATILDDLADETKEILRGT